MSIQVLEQLEKEIDGEVYLIQAFPAQFGLTVMGKMVEGNIGTADMADIVKRSVTYKGKILDDKTFGIHFSRKYSQLTKLFEEIMKFNFGEGEEVEDEEGERPLE